MKENDLFYYDLYEKLYQDGYHNDLYISHTKKLYPYLEKILNKDNNKILDLGCSHGLAVKELIDLGYDAYGIDVSKTAINLCKNRNLSTCKLGSATNIPFDDNFFNIIISSDVLEHILPIDIDIVIKEMYRVSNGYCLLSIACDTEGNNQPIMNIHKKYNEYLNINRLHTTIMNDNEWDNKFLLNGFKKLYHLSMINNDYQVIYKKI